MSEVTEQLEVFKGEKITPNTAQDLPNQCIVETSKGLALLEREEVGFRFWLPWMGSGLMSMGTALTVGGGRVYLNKEAYLNKGMETYPGDVFAVREGVVIVRDEPDANLPTGTRPLVPDDYEEKITEALHEIADENDWCREFDDLMDEVGLPTRVKNLVSTISAEISVDLDSGAHQLLSEGELPEVSIDNVNVRGDVQVEYHWRGLDDDDCPADNHDVSGLVDELLPDHYVEILDWDVVETRPDGQ